MRRIASVFSVLLSLFVAAEAVFAQDSGPPASSRQTSGFELQQNYPNPLNPETTIPFVLNEDLFVDGRPAVVSIRIFNLLQQFVASPVALGHSSAKALNSSNSSTLSPACTKRSGMGPISPGRQVASGIYFMQLTVNGIAKLGKMSVVK